MNLDFSTLTLPEVFGLLFLIALVDVAGSIALAIVGRTFDLGAVAIWLQSHVLKRAFPIFALAVLGNGIPTLSIPAIAPAFAMALAGLAAYALETIASLRTSFGGDTAPPTDTSPSFPSTEVT